MSTHRMLDSSPIPIPPARPPYQAENEFDAEAKSRTLKRSASVASLPTPPRTHHKRNRSRARSSASTHSSDESGSELDEDLGGGYAARIRVVAGKSGGLKGKESASTNVASHKKRRIVEVLEGHDEEEDENAFWTGRSRVKAPVSPPPSRRQSQAPTQTERGATPIEQPLPVTPPRRLFVEALSRRKSKDKLWPVRDSPNNPFLEEAPGPAALPSEWDTSDEESVVGEVLEKEYTPTPAKVHEEKPTITYVFRGQKTTFQNPHFELPKSVIAASRLPLEHPDFEPYEQCLPKRLFVKQKAKDVSTSSKHTTDDPRHGNHKADGSRGSSCERELVFSKPAPADSRPGSALSRSSSAEHMDKGRERADTLLRARESREKRERESKARMESKEGLRAGAVPTEKDEPARRALGPTRLSAQD